MGWFTTCGKLISFAASAYIRTSAKLKKQEVKSKDFCSNETKKFILKSLGSCQTASEDLTWWDRKITEYKLGKNDYFSSLRRIDTNSRSTKRTLCIVALKMAVKCIRAGYNEHGIRVVTYSYLALRQGDF